MRSQLLAIIMILSLGSLAFAQTQGRTRTYSTPMSTSYSSSDVHHNYISGALGFMAPGGNQLNGTLSNGTQVQPSFTLSGLIGIGADYDYMFNKDFSLGGLFRYYNVSTTINSQTYSNTLFTFGPEVKGYLPMDNWIPYLSTGLVYLAPSVTAQGQSITISSGMGLMLSMGLMYKINETVALGLETTRFIGLSNSINGNIIEDYMFKGRFALGN